MKKCGECGGRSLQQQIAEYSADLLGSPFDVILVGSVKREICEGCGKTLKTIIPDLEGLLHKIAATRASISRKLTGEEIRFLRHCVGWKAKDVAKKLEMTPENLSRVEKNSKPLGIQSERLFRVLVVAECIDTNDLFSSGTKELLQPMNLEIEKLWNIEDRMVMRFERVTPIYAEYGHDDNGTWEMKWPDQKAA